MYPNMMGINPNNINLNADSSSFPQGNTDFNNMNMNYQGFNPAMFQGQNFPQNMQMPNQEQDQEEDN